MPAAASAGGYGMYGGATKTTRLRRLRQCGERGQQQAAFADAVVLDQDFAERTARPAAAGEARIELGDAGRLRRRRSRAQRVPRRQMPGWRSTSASASSSRGGVRRGAGARARRSARLARNQRESSDGSDSFGSAREHGDSSLSSGCGGGADQADIQTFDRERVPARIDFDRREIGIRRQQAHASVAVLERA